MKKSVLLILVFLLTVNVLLAQDEPEEEKKGFKKENLFTGGGISLGFGASSYGNTFTIGASPVFGYNITNWLDAGIVLNYSYTSYQNYPVQGDKMRISNYGGGAFTKVYPFKFIYVQGQFEHNLIHQKVIYDDGNPAYKKDYNSNSFLLGAGYASGRDPEFKRPFFYIGLVVDVSGDKNSPYVDPSGAALPMIWTGFQIPLFQGKHD